MTFRDTRTLGVVVVALALAASGSAIGWSAIGGSAVGGSAIGGSAVSGGPVFGAGQTQADRTTIDSCTTIDDPGTYVLTSDIENGGKTAISKACIEITADGVTLDGGGHLVDGRGVSHTKAIAVHDAEGVTVRNVEVGDWHSGLLVTGGSATIRAVRTFSNTYGVRFEGATGGSIENSTIEENLVGVYTDTENLRLNQTEFSGNEIEVERDY